MEVDKEEINYRRATINDIETLVEYRVRFLNEIYNHPEDDETESLRRVLREYFFITIPSNEFIAWLAEHKGKVIGTSGMVIWRRTPRYGGLETGKLGYILNFYTIPEARRKGICTRLLNELIKEAKSLGLRYLHLHATEDGIKIYRRAGFIEPNHVELKLTFE